MTQIPVWSKTKTGISFSEIPTTPGGTFPDFCIIGAAKGGTSSLNTYLDSHPSIFMCPLKEPNYFSTPVMLTRGDDWYRGLYAPATTGQICGEASTSYTRYPAVIGTAERMARANPKMKLIYCVREPVSRTESDCLQVLKYARYVLDEDHTSMLLDDFYQRLSDPDDPLYCAPKETSLYADQLAQFETHFPKDQINVVVSEELRAATKDVVEDILKFLGLPPSEAIDFERRQNETGEFTDGLREDRGLEPYRSNPLYALGKKLLPEPLKASLRKKVAGDADISHLEFSPALRDQLRTGFSGPNTLLAERYGLHLQHWSC